MKNLNNLSNPESMITPFGFTSMEHYFDEKEFSEDQDYSEQAWEDAIMYECSCEVMWIAAASQTEDSELQDELDSFEEYTAFMKREAQQQSSFINWDEVRALKSEFAKCPDDFLEQGRD